MLTGQNQPFAEPILLEITDLTLDGKGIARHQGRVVFIEAGPEEALPGDLISVRVVRERKNIIHAVAETILRPSPDRVPSRCAEHRSCGGCSWQELSRERMLDWKHNQVVQTLKRIGGVELEVEPIIRSPLTEGYRNKMSFVFREDQDGDTVLGMYSRGRKGIAQVEACGLLPEPAMDILKLVRGKVAEESVPAWHSVRGCLRFLVMHMPLYRPEGKQQIVLECIVGNTDFKPQIVRMAEDLLENHGVTGFVLSERRQKSDVAQGERVLAALGMTDCIERYGELELSSPYDCFRQTNTGAASLLYDKIRELAGPRPGDVVWDIYCGTGGIGLYLAREVAQIHGFDIQPSAIAAAKDNSVRLGFDHCSFTAGPLKETLTEHTPHPHSIVVDPPRAGLDEGVARIINTLPAEKLIYVSCDVATQARDVKRLDAWRPVRSYPLDMFPDQPHVENILTFVRGSA